METLREFCRNIECYGGIQELFRALNEVSPEYANEVEQIYIDALEGVVIMFFLYDAVMNRVMNGLSDKSKSQVNDNKMA